MTKKEIESRLREIDKMRDEDWKKYWHKEITLKEYQERSYHEEYTNLVKQLSRQ